MKGNAIVIDRLNTLLADELTAINQYMIHSEMCENWGYEKLNKQIKQRAMEEMKHAEKLISRILFLDGIPKVSDLNKISIGTNIEEQFKIDFMSEKGAVGVYNDSIRLAKEKDDNGTAELLNSILSDEERHIDWLEAQLSQIEQIELKNYLVEQIA